MQAAAQVVFDCGGFLIPQGTRTHTLFDIIECTVLDWVESGGFPQGESEEFQRAAYEGLRNDPTKAAAFRDETPEI